MEKSKINPCKNCPFRTDRPFYLSRKRREEIAESITRDGIFTCHKQLKLPLGKRRPCVGSAMLLEKLDLLMANFRYRAHVLFNNFPMNIESNVPVFNSFKDFINGNKPFE
jgi:hypothetical protein